MSETPPRRLEDQPILVFTVTEEELPTPPPPDDPPLVEGAFVPLVCCSNGDDDDESVCTGCGARRHAPHHWRECIAQLEEDADGYLAELMALRRADERIEDRLSLIVTRATTALATKMTRMELAARSANARVEGLEEALLVARTDALEQSMRADTLAHRIELAAMVLTACTEVWRGVLPDAVLTVLGHEANQLHTEPDDEPDEQDWLVLELGGDEAEDEATRALRIRTVLQAAVEGLPGASSEDNWDNFDDIVHVACNNLGLPVEPDDAISDAGPPAPAEQAPGRYVARRRRRRG